ncbi:hypothetical protein O6H91_02G125200 [Diphasiastrum complanatum]|uniref:Uncharacterized protein n=1 Tax=Diphasiastrum complanatum TaxID=34168 RepID=A0ACC2EK73_DIPCM|nr:hypothetical protein O6H91_Y156600 [Diphasiastrum complanatum]KAJ7566953.1 hypothetical protein O6H91_02G125200 [Diphasiastrum complanatum]
MLRKYCLTDVMKHHTPEDCWLVIGGKVYDVTEWVPKHPGGSLIYVRAGQDCTYMFNSYHPLYVWKVLENYFIGELDKSTIIDEKLKLTNVEYMHSYKEPFYLTLKERVEAYFHKEKINPKIHPQLFIKSVVVLVAYFLIYYLTFFQDHPYVLSYLYAIGLGYMTTHIALSIMHDDNHGAFSIFPPLSYVMGMSLDLIGASSFMWKQQHVIAHHSFTNVNKYDPDIRANDRDMRRHLYLWPLYGLMTLKSFWFDDLKAFFTGYIGEFPITKMTPLEKKIFWGSKAFYILYASILPLMFGAYDWLTILRLYITSQCYDLRADEATFTTINLIDGVPTIPYGWAAMQVYSSTNYCTNSLLWTHLSGALNLQIEHHLFPGVCHMHYPSIQPIVEATCKEFHIPYRKHSSFWDAVKAHYKHLKNLGTKSMEP